MALLNAVLAKEKADAEAEEAKKQQVMQEAREYRDMLLIQLQKDADDEVGWAVA